MIPRIGQEVTVRVRNSLATHRHLYAAGVVTEFETFTGKVCAPEKWQDPKRTLNLTTGIRSFPIRSLSLDNVVSIDGKRHEAKKTDMTTKTWTVPGSKGNVYTITEVNGQRSCTCVGYSFRRTCKHVIGGK